MVVLNVRNRLDVCPGELAAVENEIELALGVVRIEEGMCTDEGAIAHGGTIAHPRRPILSIAGIASINTSLAVPQRELDPDITRSCNVWIGLFWGVKFKPSDGVSGTTGAGGRLRDLRGESRRNGRD